ncbi:MAG TPA: TfoX/Sxy family protein [Burkholderiaceae bacterium]|jgi:DNA transformation protein and related proteins|nr:TfoX/Sxy family protein [Burkholderiaceae bacterium]HPH15245.1 TfoX/Sxy family protein [Burkholderiaceae bacterium]
MSPRHSEGSSQRLPNLGSKSSQFLQAAGIHSLDQLERLGAVAAYVQAKQANPSVTLNLLWALEGALTGLPWQQVAREQRTRLLMALELYSGVRKP